MASALSSDGLEETYCGTAGLVSEGGRSSVLLLAMGKVGCAVGMVVAAVVVVRFVAIVLSCFWTLVWVAMRRLSYLMSVLTLMWNFGDRMI